MYSLEQKKRGLCPYDDKRYLLADLPDGSPNPYTHAYGHKDLADEEEFEADMPDAPGSDLIIEHRERRFFQKHARVAKKLSALPGHHGDQETDSAEEEEEIPGDVALSTGDWDKAAKVAAARPGVPGRIEDVLQRLFAAGRPVSPPPQPPVFDAQRAGPSGTHRPDPKAKRALIYSSDDDDKEEPLRRRRKRARNPFVFDEEVEADDEECSLDGEYDNAYADPFYF